MSNGDEIPGSRSTSGADAPDDDLGTGSRSTSWTNVLDDDLGLANLKVGVTGLKAGEIPPGSRSTSEAYASDDDLGVEDQQVGEIPPDDDLGTGSRSTSVANATDDDLDAGSRSTSESNDSDDDLDLMSALVVVDGEPIGMSAAARNDVIAARFAFEIACAAGDAVLIRQLHNELLAEVGDRHYAEALQVAVLVLVNSVIPPLFDALGEAKEAVLQRFRASAAEFYALEG